MGILKTLTIAVFILSTAQWSFATSCVISALDQFDYFEKSPLVFRGTAVTSVNQSADPGGWDYPFGGAYQAQVLITKVYKGDPDLADTLITLNTDQLEMDKEYVFFPSYNEDTKAYSALWCGDLVYPAQGDIKIQSGSLESEASTRDLLKELERIADFERDGVLTTYYENGMVKVERTFKKGIFNLLLNQEGVLHGPRKTYYSNGLPRSNENYVRGLAQGPFRYYHDNGELWEEGRYKNGKRDGLSTVYGKDGTSQRTVLYKDGVPR